MCGGERVRDNQKGVSGWREGQSVAWLYMGGPRQAAKAMLEDWGDNKASWIDERIFLDSAYLTSDVAPHKLWSERAAVSALHLQTACPPRALGWVALTTPPLCRTD
jgi:hypothetical protein